MTTTVATSQHALAIRGLPGVAIRVGAALEEWGRSFTPVTDRDELELRHWAENEARLAAEARDQARSLQMLLMIR